MHHLCPVASSKVEDLSSHDLPVMVIPYSSEKIGKVETSGGSGIDCIYS